MPHLCGIGPGRPSAGPPPVRWGLDGQVADEDRTSGTGQRELEFGWPGSIPWRGRPPVGASASFVAAGVVEVVEFGLAGGAFDVAHRGGTNGDKPGWRAWTGTSDNGTSDNRTGMAPSSAMGRVTSSQAAGVVGDLFGVEYHP